MTTQAPARARPEPKGSGVVTSAFLSAFASSAWLVVPALVPLTALAPLPVTLQRLTRGAFAGYSAAILAALLIAATSSNDWALRYAVYLALPGLIIGGQMARGRGLTRGCLLAFLWLAAVIGAQLVFDGPEIASQLLTSFEQVSGQFVEGMRTSGVPADRVDEVHEQLRGYKAAIQVVYPAALFIQGALLVLLNGALLRAYLLRRDPGWLDGGEFETLRLPFVTAIVFVISGLLVTLKATQPLAYNLLLLVAFFFALQGLAVTAYYAHRLAGPPALRVAVVILVLLNPWAPQILALLGLFDTWFDFRKWADPPQEESGE
jgi:uncharacterized protein YybS (DUF2232 family)